MARRVTAERLDQLPPEDPGAMRSRRDLRRINVCMGNARLLLAALRSGFDGGFPQRIIDLGAGDGTLLLSIAKHLGRDGARAHALLLDKQALVAPATRTGFEELGWQVETAREDVFDRLRDQPHLEGQAIIANLFLHHFSDSGLRELLGHCAQRCRIFVAVDPRRSTLALTMSRMLWLIGCNSVTRHDAVASVRAGFAGADLTRLWPAARRWSLTERPAGWVSHLFLARRC